MPNISASVAQLVAAIKELQSKGYKLPDFPETRRPTRKSHPARYAKCPGQRGESGAARRQFGPPRAKRCEGIRAQEPARMARVDKASRTHVSHMHHGDFYAGEKSMTLDRARDVKMELITKSGKTIVLKPKVALLDGEIIDSMFMSRRRCATSTKADARTPARPA